MKKYFINVITKQYADFSTVTTRKEFWMFQLIGFLITIPFIALEQLSVVILIASLALNLALFIPSIAITARRLHSRNMSGWWMLVPFLAFIVALLPNYSVKDISKKYGGEMI